MGKPLENIRVLDLTRLLPGPYCTMLFADFGAEVIKVEDPNGGDYARWNEPKAGEHNAMFTSLNRNKKSVTFNLKEEQQRQQFIELVKTADVLVESFRPGVMDRLGVGYDTLKELNPELVYCAITGYGQTGPYKDKPGHDINYLSYAGLLHFQGERNRKPIPPATQIADIGGGLMAAVGVLMALMHRSNSGKGQFVDISMMDGSVSWLQTLLPDFLAGLKPERGELTLSGGKACYEVYETADHRFLSVGALEPKFWTAFCKGLGKEDFIPLLDAPLNDQIELRNDIEHIIAKKSLNEWMEIFRDIEACVEPVLTLDEVVDNPQIKARRMIVDLEDKRFGEEKQIGIPIKLSETPGGIIDPAPKLGQHNDYILNQLKQKLGGIADEFRLR